MGFLLSSSFWSVSYTHLDVYKRQMLAFGHFPIFAVSALAFILVFTITNYVSLGSMVLYLCFLVQVIFLGQRGEFGMSQGHLTELYIVAACLTALAF